MCSSSGTLVNTKLEATFEQSPRSLPAAGSYDVAGRIGRFKQRE